MCQTFYFGYLLSLSSDIAIIDRLKQFIKTELNMLTTIKEHWLSNVRGDVLAGMVVALALIPEAIAFSIIAWC